MFGYQSESSIFYLYNMTHMSRKRKNHLQDEYPPNKKQCVNLVSDFTQFIIDIHTRLKNVGNKDLNEMCDQSTICELRDVMVLNQTIQKLYVPMIEPLANRMLGNAIQYGMCDDVVHIILSFIHLSRIIPLYMSRNISLLTCVVRSKGYYFKMTHEKWLNDHDWYNCLGHQFMHVHSDYITIEHRKGQLMDQRVPKYIVKKTIIIMEGMDRGHIDPSTLHEIMTRTEQLDLITIENDVPADEYEFPQEYTDDGKGLFGLNDQDTLIDEFENGELSTIGFGNSETMIKSLFLTGSFLNIGWKEYAQKSLDTFTSKKKYYLHDY
jgi:hypothetical protein